MAADGSALYVGLNGSGDVVKLSLPGMAEQWRTRLPNAQRAESPGVLLLRAGQRQ